MIISSNFSNKETSSKECYQTRSYAMIVHGLGESCETFWVKDLRRSKWNKLNKGIEFIVFRTFHFYFLNWQICWIIVMDA